MSNRRIIKQGPRQAERIRQAIRDGAVEAVVVERDMPGGSVDEFKRAIKTITEVPPAPRIDL